MRRSSLVLFAALVVGAGGASVAWACTPQAYLYLGTTSVKSSPAGGATPVTVSGKGFIPAAVQIHLDSGPALATATGPDFSIQVRIPRAAPGVHYVRAVAYQPDGTVAGEATRALMVTAPAPAPAPAPAVRPAPAHHPAPAGAVRPAPVRHPAVVAQPARHRPRPNGASSVTPSAIPAPVVHQIAAAAPVVKPKRVTHGDAPRPARPVAAPVRNPWTVRAPAGPSLTDRAAGGDASRSILAVAIGLLALALAGLGGAGFALVRMRTRSPAPEPALDELAVPVIEPETVSMEAELQELIAENHARGALRPAGRDEQSPRERVDSPH